jgi:peptide/nickel transport system substrate-binding protein
MLIRTEDQRLEIGDYVSDLMEDLGFETDRMYRTSSEAAPIWLYGDPADGEFHIYTAGWISTAISRDDSDAKAFFYTDMGLPFPLYQAYDPDPKFYDIADKLNSGDYDTWEERMDLMRTGTIMALEDSARVFLVDQLAPFVQRSDIELAFDLSGGFSNPLWALTIRKKGEVGGILTAGSAEILTQPWNPEGGTNWLYDSIILGAVRERYSHIYNPYTGLPMPLRMQSVSMDVARGVPTSSSTDWCTVNVVDQVQVPEDAWVDWDVESKEFITAGTGTTAKVKMAINYGDCIGNWKYHDGSVMSMADWLIPMIIDYEQADPDSTIYDKSTVAEFESEKSTFKGMRIASESPLIIEYWTDYITREAEFIYTFIADRQGVNVDIYPQIPWHATAIGIKAEEEGLLAFSADKSEELEIEWTNYLGGPSEAILEEKLEEALSTSYVPFGGIVNDYLTSEEITTRYENLKQWHDDRGHFWVGSGAFYLDQVDFVGHSAVIKAFRDYPFKADRFARLAEPPIPVSSVSVPDNIIPGLGAIIDYELTYKGDPYPNDKIELTKYMVLDSAGNLITVGEAEPGEEGKWLIGLDSTETARLEAGSYRLITVALSTDVAKPGILDTPFVVLPDLLSYVEALMASREADIKSDIAEIESSLSETQNTVAELQTGAGLENRVSSLSTITYIAVFIAVIAVVVAAYGIISKK